MKERVFEAVDRLSDQLVALSDDIFDHPESGGEEVYASGLLTGLLEANGFALERGTGELPTAFRAVYENGSGGTIHRPSVRV